MMRTADFDFDLPDGLVALRPAQPCTDARLLVSHGDTAPIVDDRVANICTYLRPGDRLVLNDTRVIPARLFGTRTRVDGPHTHVAKVEITLFEPLGDGAWRVMAKPLRKLKPGDDIDFGP